MRSKADRKYPIVKIVFGLVAAFLAFVAFWDFTPTQRDVETTVIYGQK